MPIRCMHARTWWRTQVTAFCGQCPACCPLSLASFFAHILLRAVSRISVCCLLICSSVSAQDILSKHCHVVWPYHIALVCLHEIQPRLSHFRQKSVQLCSRFQRLDFSRFLKTGYTGFDSCDQRETPNVQFAAWRQRS